MEMVDLKRTKAEKKADKENYSKPIGGTDDYSYNTRHTLDHETLDKLGMDTLPKVGSKLKVHAIAHVVGTSDNQDENGKKRRRVELRFHHMGVEPHDETDIDAAQGAKNSIDKALEGMAKGEK